MKTILLAELGEALVGAGLAGVVGTLALASGVALGESLVLLVHPVVTLVAGVQIVLLAEVRKALVGTSLTSMVGTLAAAGGVATAAAAAPVRRGTVVLDLDELLILSACAVVLD